MGLGLTKKKATLSEMEALVERNQSITNVFARTVQDLKDVNFDMELVRERKSAEAEILMQEAESLKAQQEVNVKVMTKINDFLN
mgnify:CR=1 FL=1